MTVELFQTIATEVVTAVIILLSWTCGLWVWYRITMIYPVLDYIEMQGELNEKSSVRLP